MPRSVSFQDRGAAYVIGAELKNTGGAAGRTYGGFADGGVYEVVVESDGCQWLAKGKVGVSKNSRKI